MRRGPAPVTEQDRVTRRYDRMAWRYETFDAPMDWMGTRKRRRRLLSGTQGRTLEVGIGTGKNLAHYPVDTDLIGIDVSGSMLRRARERAHRIGISPILQVADVTDLPFADDTFDTAVATCVFCSVADPVAGLGELERVVRPGGRILLLEHVRPRNRAMGRLADLITPLTRRWFGFRANRRTEDNVAAAGLDVIEVRRTRTWREMVVRSASDASRGSIATYLRSLEPDAPDRPDWRILEGPADGHDEEVPADGHDD